MKKFLLCFIGILLVMVETSITNYINLFGISFNLVLIYMTIIAMYRDELEVGLIGAIVGLVKDITVGGVFGVNAIILFAVAFSISHLRGKIYKENYITIFALVFVASLFDSLVNIGTATFVYKSYEIINITIRGIAIIPLLNSFVSLIVYMFFKESILKLKED